MSGLGQKLRGNLYLAYRALIAHPLRRLLSDEEGSGRQRFLDNYGPEGNVPFTPADRAVLSGASRCIHCGLCDAYDQGLVETSRQLYGGASLLAPSYARATPDLIHARAALAEATGARLLRAEAVCPTRVPLRAIAEVLRRKLAELDELKADAARRAPSGPPEPPPATGALPQVEPQSSRLAGKAPDSAANRVVPPLAFAREGV